ncbi:MAG: hypothetical protein RSD40_06855, partial [Bacilli bacterium]
MECTQKEGSFLVLNSNNVIHIEANFILNILNEQTFKFHLNKLKTIDRETRQTSDLIVTSFIEFISLYTSQFHKNKEKSPVAIIENASSEEHQSLPILQFYPARDQIYISCYNSEVESEWLMGTSMEKEITIDTYRNFYRKTIIPKSYFLNEELLDTKISGIFLNKGNNYIFNHNDLFNHLALLSPYSKNIHYKYLHFPHINMDVEHPNYINAKVMNLKNISKMKMTIYGHFFDLSNCNASKISISLDFLGEAAHQPMIFLEKCKYSHLKIYQHRHSYQNDNIKTPFIFLKNCKTCDIITRPTTFFIIADTHKEKYENRSIIVDASAEDLYHKIIFLTNNDIETENRYKQIIPWLHMDNSERLQIIKTFQELLPALEERYKLKFPYVKESILRAMVDNTYIQTLNPKLMSQFLRNIRSLESDFEIEFVEKK